MHGLMEIKKLNARTAKPMDNTFGGQPTNPPHAPKTDHGILAGTGVIGTQDRIESAIDQKPDSPFMQFWNNHNQTKGEIGYSEARKLFGGGLTPAGTLILAESGDGLRAVPAPSVPYLGGNRPAWYGDYREVTDKGTIWHRVNNASALPIIYTDPSYAIDAARVERSARIEQAFR